MHRPLGPDTIGVSNTGYDGRPAPTSRKPLTTGDHWLWWLPNLWSSQADPVAVIADFPSSALWTVPLTDPHTQIAAGLEQLVILTRVTLGDLYSRKSMVSDPPADPTARKPTRSYRPRA